MTSTERLKTTILLGPYSVGGPGISTPGAYVLVKGIPGNTALHRVTRGWR